MAPRSRNLAPALCSLALLLPLFYVLSTGPVLGLYHRGYLGANSGWYVSTLYHPLECACGTSPTFTRVIVWYATLWMPTPLPGIPLFGVY
jgi:hypothetical protein